MLKNHTKVCCLFLAFATLAAGAVSFAVTGDLDAIKKILPATKVKITREAIKSKSARVTAEKFMLAGSGVPIEVLYHPSLLLSGQMRIGFDSPFEIWGYWHSGGCIKVLVNGRDYLGAAPATRVEFEEGEDYGYLRFIWKTGRGDSFALNLAVPDDGHCVYMRIDLSITTLKVESVQVQLRCYPGGFGPAYKLPSHRWVVTPGGEGEVPQNFEVTEDKKFPEVKLSEGDGWIFYADKRANDGSLGLIVLPQEKPCGKVAMSNYAQNTILNYPTDTREIHLGVFAYGITNKAAMETFADSVKKEQQVLRTISFWSSQKAGN